MTKLNQGLVSHPSLVKEYSQQGFLSRGKINKEHAYLI